MGIVVVVRCRVVNIIGEVGEGAAGGGTSVGPEDTVGKSTIRGAGVGRSDVGGVVGQQGRVVEGGGPESRGPGMEGLIVVVIQEDGRQFFGFLRQRQISPDNGAAEGTRGRSAKANAPTSGDLARTGSIMELIDLRALSCLGRGGRTMQSAEVVDDGLVKSGHVGLELEVDSQVGVGCRGKERLQLVYDELLDAGDGRRVTVVHDALSEFGAILDLLYRLLHLRWEYEVEYGRR